MSDSGSPPTPQKIAILGGGVSAMTTAYFLTSQPDWQSRYDITLYQMGWRLGGKGASGRNPDIAQRIEEHGLHIWFGFYENAFRMIKDVYAEANRPAGAPLATWDEAFKRHSYIVLDEMVRGNWQPWAFDMPEDEQEPGTGNETPTVWDIFLLVIRWMEDHYKQSPFHQALSNRREPSQSMAKQSWWLELGDKVKRDVDQIADEFYTDLLTHARLLAESLDKDASHHDSVLYPILVEMLSEFKHWLWHEIEDKVDADDALRHFWIELDLGVTLLVGMFADGVVSDDDWDLINDIELKAWLAKHGASQLAIDSAIVIGIYDLVFAYRNGDVTQPDYEAGTALRATLRILLCYRGAIMWKMQAGMGDTIFAPMYSVLKKRGVKFEFFHRVKSLNLDAGYRNGKAVKSITMARQATVKNGAAYDPIVRVKDLDCWPSVPDYTQLEQGALLKHDQINLESYWSPWNNSLNEQEIVLEAGQHFDQIVLGISVGALAYVCPDMVADKSNPKFKAMVEKVETVQTQAYQLWLKPNLAQMGWQAPSPVLGTFTEPLDTWADMTYLLGREDWPADLTPANIAYFCGVIETPKQLPPQTDYGFPARQKANGKAQTIAQLNEVIWNLWPNAVDKNKQFDWNLLIDPVKDRSGVARFDSQFQRVNVDPSERYVLSITGSSVYRLAANQSGYENLFLTGDWIKNGLNVGCVEASVMAGMQTSRAISGYPQKIIGDDD
ncbi:MAG: NAD(P)-binding protein [Pseudomonadota bacterium]